MYIKTKRRDQVRVAAAARPVQQVAKAIEGFHYFSRIGDSCSFRMDHNPSMSMLYLVDEKIALDHRCWW